MKLIATVLFAGLFITGQAQATDFPGNCDGPNPPFFCDLGGEQGPKGDKGDTGDTGAAGAAGQAGSDGAQGASGSRGPKGDTGPGGVTGATGQHGATGNTGSTGRDGASPLGSLSMSAAAFAIPAGKSGIGFGMSSGYQYDSTEFSAVLKKGWKDKSRSFVVGGTVNQAGKSAVYGGVGFSF